MTQQRSTDYLQKLRTIQISRRGLVAAAAATALAARQGLDAAAQDSPQVLYTGEVFDAGGATLRVASWPGFWEEMERKYLLDPLAAEFNCKIEYDNAFPWSPKFAAGGVDNPPSDVQNWNLPDLFLTARIGAVDGGYFVPIEELKANLPVVANLWDFAYGNGHGITYLFSQYGYAYRTDTVNPPPADFKAFWEDRFADKRATYITVNTLQMVFFMMASIAWGKDEFDIDAGVDAMKRAMPMKISDFTGNMQTLIERGEIDICVQHDGEPYAQIDRGVPLGWMYWTDRNPILTQTKTVSKNIGDVQKKLAYAYIDRACSPAFQEEAAKQVYLRPSNKLTTIPENLASKGVANTEDAMSKLWIPPWDWYLDNQDEIDERVNEIIGAA